MQDSLNLEEMKIDEKFLIMEQIWESLSANATEQGFTPEWHLDKLSDREERVRKGTATFDDISKVKERLQKLANENKNLR